MKGFALLLCAVALAQAERPQLSLSGRVCDCNSEEAKAACSQYDSDSELFMHENCNQFYKCSNGQAIPYFCSTGLVYDHVTQICDWPSNVNCGSRPIVDESEVDCSKEVEDNDDSSSDSGLGPETGTCNCNPDEAPKICAASGSDGVLVAHENCNKFYKCENGVNVPLHCPSGLMYNPYTKQCDWADNVECKDRPIIEIEEDGNDGGEDDCSEENNNADGDNGVESGPCNCNPEEAPGICAIDGSDGTLVAHENCNQFYKCANGSPVTVNCPLGLLYNPFISVCDWPHNVDCAGKPIEIDGGNNGDGSGNGNGDNGSGNENGDSGSPGTCNCNPGEAPGICATDGSDGTLIAHENCNQFYKCANGVPVTMNCPTGLVYNPYIECCDWPSNVECDGPVVEVDGENGNGDGGTGNGNGDNGTVGGTCNCKPEESPAICAAENSDGILIAHEKCNKFYKCLFGKPVAIECPGKLLYNPYIERCDWPKNVDCAYNVIPDGGDNGGNENDGDTEDGSEGTCNCNPDEAPGICSAPDSDGILIAHEKCNKLYKCAEGVPVALKCPENLLYNPHTQQCDWQYNVECGDRIIVDENDNGGSDNGGNGNGNGDSGGTCNCNPGEAPAICANEDSDGILIAHEKCNKFYMCSFGTPVAISCPGNLQYNPYNKVCDWPENVECGDRLVGEIDNGGNGGNGGGNDHNNGNCDPSEAPAICSAPGSDGILVAHENCNQFYKCSEGLPVALTCPSMLLYNSVTGQCDWPQNVDCGDRVVSGGNDNGGNGDNGGHGDNGDGDNQGNGSEGSCNCNPDEAPGICSAPDSDGILIAHEKCNKLYKCAEGVPVALKCPENLLYNPHTQQCDWQYNVECGDRIIVDENDNGGSDNGGNGNGNGDSGGTCNCNPGEAPAVCANEDSDGILIAHEKCNKFYMCSFGTPVAISCPGNLQYNPYNKVCDWPENVECGDRLVGEIDNGGNGGNGGGNDHNNGNCDPSEAPAICSAPGSDGILVAHENCNQFYKCSEGLPVALTCPSMLLYNSVTGQCDWPQNVDCGDRVVSGGNDNGGNGDNGGHGDNGDGDNQGNGSEGSCNCNPDEAPGICSAPDSDGILIAHEKCNKLYKCAEGVPVALKCPENLLYNPHTQQCDWQYNVECGDRIIVDENDNGGSDNGVNGNGNGDSGGTCNCNPGEAPAICANEDSDGILIAHEKCNKFYMCSFGTPVAISCPGNLQYNPYNKVCDWPENVECGDRPVGEIDNGGNGGNGDNGGGNDNNNGNCDPSEAPAICSAPGSDGILVAHENCNQFYKCSEGLPVALTCPSMLLYNSVTGQCDWPQNVDCGDRVVSGGNDNGGNGDNGDNGDSESNGGHGENESNNGGTCNCYPGDAPAICSTGNSEGALIAHEKCNKFYKCSYGSPVAIACSGNLLYNPYKEVCDWPEKVECGDRLIPESSGGSDSGSDHGGSDNGSNGGNCDPSQAPAICAAEGSNGVLVAHEKCDQFYVCSYGLPVALSCPGNLLYNPSTEQCDWASTVDCGDRVVPAPNVDNDDVCLCNYREAPGVCAASGSDGKMIAHEKCDQFYVCFNAQPIARSCPASLFYDPHTQACNWPAAVNCDRSDLTSRFSLNKHMEARRF